MSGGDKENPKTVMDSVEFLDGSAAERGFESISSWFGEKASDGASYVKGKALDAAGFKDIDNDGDREFDWKSALKNGGIGTLVFMASNKLFGAGKIKSAVFAAIAVLVANFFPKITDAFNDVVKSDNAPTTEMANAKTYPNKSALDADENNYVVQSTAEKNKVNLTLKAPETGPV